MNIHRNCPHCESEGIEIDAQDESVNICENEACRVYTFATYYG